MKKSIQFEKVSLEEYEKAMQLFCLEFNSLKNSLKKIYDNIKLPRRENLNVAGYDFFTPFSIKLKQNQTIMLPTGIRCKMPSNWVLLLFPRSSLGFKYRLQLENTVGVIDADNTNKLKGQILIKLRNDTRDNKIFEISSGEGIAQGIFLEYGITIDDNPLNQ